MLSIFFQVLSIFSVFHQAGDDDFLKAREFMTIMQFDSAQHYFSKAIDQKPDYDEAYFWRAITKEELQDMEGAIEDYSTAILINKTPKYLNNRGMSYMVLSRMEEAQSDFSAAIDLDPKYDKAWFNRGFVFHQKGEPEKACENIREAYKLGLAFAKSYLDEYCF